MPSGIFIGLGSNLDDPLGQLQRAIAALRRLPGTEVVGCSRFYRSAPMGPQDQPDYVNAVVELRSSLQPLALLDALQAIEAAQGRVRDGQRWGPRTLDLDLLLYAGQDIELPRLQVPHPGLPERNFVLYPLQELAPDLVLPDGRDLAELVHQCPVEGLEPCGEPSGDGAT